ncbi:E3.1.11.2 [Mytilus coruscus]|uniref:E3.1.11.2 n=1 Tax=Mytilus coruscus TaxID=42192 RepID=A0A6J8CQ71_MYTCO|nr:E3.1.11.2 [Mytilus coruscus]
MHSRTLATIFGKNIAKEINKKFSTTIKSVDDEYLILDYKAIRGYGGTAIFWQKDLNNAVNIMPDGNARIQVLTINSSPNPICLINIYMPSAQSSGDNEYKDTLDQISEIMDKYKELYQIILCGDMNASLHRDNRKRDKLFEEIKNINNLHIPDSYPIKPTIFHHNGKYTSQIDYILFNEKCLQQIKPAVKIASRHPTNTSDHTLVTTNFVMNVKRCTLRPTKIYTRPNWKKCDKSVYKSTIENSLGKTSGQNNIPNNVESRIQKLESALHKAGMKSIPNYGKLKTLKSVGKGIWNSKISQASTEAKSAHKIWKDKTIKNQDAVLEKQNLKKKNAVCDNYRDRHMHLKRKNS